MQTSVSSQGSLLCLNWPIEPNNWEAFDFTGNSHVVAKANFPQKPHTLFINKGLTLYCNSSDVERGKQTRLLGDIWQIAIYSCQPKWMGERDKSYVVTLNKCWHISFCKGFIQFNIHIFYISLSSPLNNSHCVYFPFPDRQMLQLDLARVFPSHSSTKIP